MKVLYAAGNRLGSHYQLKRFLNSVGNKNLDIKIAAFKKSLGDLDAHYTLDCLLNFTKPDNGINFNGNYSYYRNEIKRFNPDLIISDFEVYTSILANELKVKLWQFSPVNLYYALTSSIKQGVGIHKYYSHLIDSNQRRAEYVGYMFANSNRKFVLSHLCDCAAPPALLEDYEWVRPSFVLGESKYNSNYLIVLADSNKKVLDDFKNKNSILFSPFIFESFKNMKNFPTESDEYKFAVEQCKAFITDGTECFLADAFYNGKYSFSNPRYDDIESITCSFMNEYCGIGKVDFGETDSFSININEKVKFISEYLDEL